MRNNLTPMDTNPNFPQNPGPQGPQNPGAQGPGPLNPGAHTPGPQGPQQPQVPGAQYPGAQNPGQQNPGAQYPGAQSPGPQDGLTRPLDPAAQPSGAHTRPESGQQPPVPPTQGPSGRGPQGEPGKPGKPAKKKLSKGKIIGLSAVGLVALLVILLVGSELYIRNHVQNCLADNVKQGTQAENVDVSFAKTPMLIQNASGKISSIDIQIDGMQNTPGLNAHLLLKGVEPSGDNKVDDATILGTFTADGIKNKVAGSQVISDPKVTLNTAENQIEISGTAVILPVTVNLKPTIKDNKVVLTASKASVFGIGVPDDLAQQLITAVADIPTPKGLTASDLKMTEEGISMRYSGQNVLPKDIESGSDVGASNCSVV